MSESFTPIYGSGSTVAPSGTSARTNIGTSGSVALVTNLGSAIVYVKTGGSAVDATAADFPVYPSNQVTINKQVSDDYIAYITGGDTGSIHIMSGDGE